MKKTKKLKRNLVLGAAGILVLLLTACGSNGDATNLDLQDGEKETVTQTNKEENSKTAKYYKNNSVLFSTEYDVEDYCKGCFIVSKNNGLLYGLLDMNGKEILPVKYDELYFMNNASVKAGRHKNIYIETVYEGEHNIFDAEGNMVSNKDLSVIESEHFDNKDVNMPFFMERESTKIDLSVGTKYTIYNENMEKLSYYEMKDYYSGTWQWLNNKSFLVSGMGEVHLYNINEGDLKEWSVQEHDVDYIYLDSVDKKTRTSINLCLPGKEREGVRCLIDNDGTIIREEPIDGGYVRVIKVSPYHPGYYILEDDVLLDKSNGTWKLIDPDGTLYDERYYDCHEYKEDENICYLLTDEDSNICVIDRFGNMITDYGVIDSDYMESYDYLTINGGMKTNDKILVGEGFSCFVVKNGEKNDVYYCTGTQERKNKNE